MIGNSIDVIFNASGSILTSSNACFDVIIVDDEDIQYNEGITFYLEIYNNYYYYDYTSITIVDNEG